MSQVVNAPPVKGDVLSLRIPEGDLSGTVSVEGFPGYHLNRERITREAPKEIMISLQAGGTIVVPVMGEGMRDAVEADAVEPRNPVRWVQFSYVDMATLGPFSSCGP